MITEISKYYIEGQGNPNTVIPDGLGRTPLMYMDYSVDPTVLYKFDPALPSGSKWRNLDEIIHERFIPKYAIADVRATELIDQVIIIVDDNKVGTFVYDLTDVISADNEGTILVDDGGRRYKRQFTGPINVKWFGAVGDGATDDQPAIQNAVDYAINISKDAVYLPPGRYLINDTITLGIEGFNSIKFYSDIYKYRGEGMFNGATIIANFSDRMAINFMGARGSEISGIAFLGKLTTLIDTNGLGSFTPNVDSIDHTNWNDPLLDTNQDSRYAPYAAITTDAYAGVEPTPSYPGDYNKNFYSSNVKIINCYFFGFNTAIVSQPCNVSANSDFLNVTDCNFDSVKYAISIGNSQSRNVEIDRCTFGTIHTCFVNNKHGQQIGKFGGEISNCSFDNINYIFELKTDYALPISVKSFYGERLYSIGIFYNGSSSQPSMTIQDSHFSFRHYANEKGIPSNVMSSQTTLALGIYFLGCYFDYKSVIGFDCEGLKFDNCMAVSFDRDVSGVTSYLRYAHNALSGGLVIGKFNQEIYQNIRYKRYNLDNGALNLIENDYDYTNSARYYGSSIYAKYLYPLSESKVWSVLKPLARINHQKATFTNTSILGDTITFDLNYPNTQRLLYGGLIGDVIVCTSTRTVFFITNLVGNTYTAIAQNNIKLVSGNIEFIQPFDFVTGDFYFLHCRIYTPPTILQGTFTASSAIFSNAGAPNGATTSLAQISIGDSIYNTPSFDSILSDSGGQISNINVGTSEITFAGTATYSEDRRRLPLFVRAI